MIKASNNPFSCTPVILTSGIVITPYNAKVNYDGSDITVPNGFTGTVTNLNDTYADVIFTVDGTALTITSGASNGEILLINGKY